MFSKIKTAALSAVIAFGAIAAVPAAANAGDVDVDIHIGGGFGFGGGYGGGWGGGYGGGYGGYGYKACTSGKALHKAKWMGVKKAYVAAVGKHKIVVAGKKNGHYIHVTFGKAPHCPVKW